MAFHFCPGVLRAVLSEFDLTDGLGTGLLSDSSCNWGDLWCADDWPDAPQDDATPAAHMPSFSSTLGFDAVMTSVVRLPSMRFSGAFGAHAAAAARSPSAELLPGGDDMFVSVSRSDLWRLQDCVVTAVFVEKVRPTCVCVVCLSPFAGCRITCSLSVPRVHVCVYGDLLLVLCIRWWRDRSWKSWKWRIMQWRG